MRSVSAEREVHRLTLLELPLAGGRAQRRATAQHDQQLFPGVVEVVDHEIPRLELVEGDPEPRPLGGPRQALRAAAASRPVLVLLAPLVAPDAVGHARNTCR